VAQDCHRLVPGSARGTVLRLWCSRPHSRLGRLSAPVPKLGNSSRHQLVRARKCVRGSLPTGTVGSTHGSHSCLIPVRRDKGGGAAKIGGIRLDEIEVEPMLTDEQAQPIAQARFMLIAMRSGSITL